MTMFVCMVECLAFFAFGVPKYHSTVGGSFWCEEAVVEVVVIWLGSVR